MAVQAVLALHRSLKKVNNRLEFRLGASEIRSKLFLALTEKTLNQEPKKLWFCYFGIKVFHLTKKSGDLIFRSGTDRSKIRETAS